MKTLIQSNPPVLVARAFCVLAIAAGLYLLFDSVRKP